MTKIIDFSDQAKYNIKTVGQKTGVLPVTLRAWERRYQILTPKRGQNGYRLYSDRDIAILSWIKLQLETGVSISAASEEIRLRAKQGIWPEINQVPSITFTPTTVSFNTLEEKSRLYEALVKHDETSAAAIFGDALSALPLVSLFEELLVPTLVEVGESWYHGRIQVATEHFASNFFRGRLLSIYQSLSNPHSTSRILIGSAPGELHEIGPMMMAVLIREAGYRVEYLGADLPLEDLVFYARGEHPRLIILSATMCESALDLARVEDLLKTIKPRPRFGFGGAAFSIYPELVPQTPGVYLGRTLAESLSSVKSILESKVN